VLDDVEFYVISFLYFEQNAKLIFYRFN